MRHYIEWEVKKKEILDKGNIFNMDETPIYLEMVIKTTIAKICTKSVNVEEGEHFWIAVIFAVEANGIKLTPLKLKRFYKEGETSKIY